ncbi:unnamed protein product [Meloidogyne enterolobii]|uniref:Uncharacterized protein n=2 Tax=Meloidogyne enterolobii TaxID=390850 RepID=A0ACB1A266_MELEN|nr:unnamed protein product [Meloidogyne enterolobii]
MLFCLLHPMDHNTGPLARKSSTLCALLLVSIAALLLLAVPGQAIVEEVGVANHIKNGSDVTLKPVSKPASDDLTYAEYVKLFPTVCNFFINETYIELLYENRGCTVELITEQKKEKIKLTAGMYLGKAGCKLDDFKGFGPNFKHGFSNLLPFAYSRTNKEIKELNRGPTYNDNVTCEKKECGEQCMNHTFLEVSWNMYGKEVGAHTHLIGERETGLDQKNTGAKMEFNLEINADSSFRMLFDPEHKIDFDPEDISCAPKGNVLPRPETWKIKDGDLKDKYLLVFHLLPQTASIKYEGNKHKGNLGDEGPKCDLFIRFNRTDDGFQFLQVDPQTTTTSTTTTTKPSTKSSTTSTAIGTTPTPRPQQGTTTNVEVKDTKKGSSAGKVIFVLVMLVIVSAMIGVCVYAGLDYRKKQQKEKEEEAAKAAATEAAKAAETAAAGAAKAEDEKERAAKQSDDEAAGGKKTEDSKAKNDQAPKEETTSKDSTLKKDPAPEKADATKSKQAGTTSDVPTDMVSEAKETEQ